MLPSCSLLQTRRDIKKKWNMTKMPKYSDNLTQFSNLTKNMISLRHLSLMIILVFTFTILIH